MDWTCFLPILIMLFLFFISPRPKPGQAVQRTAESDNYAMVVGIVLGLGVVLILVISGGR